MKQQNLHIAFASLGLVLILLLGGCTADSTHEAEQTSMRELRFVLGGHNYSDVTPAAPHRALPSGYVVYSDLATKIPEDEAALRCYMTQGDEAKFQGNVTYRSGTWVSKIPLDNGDYYVYGLMPGTEASKVESMTALSGNYNNGAVMNIKGLSAVTTSDVCAIVGVKGSGSASNTDITTSGIQLGSFKYNAEEGTDVYLLIDHLYAAIQLNMNINEDYNALRHIRLTKLTLQSSTVNTVNMTVTMTANETNTSPLTATPPTVTAAATGEGTDIEIYKGEEQELQVYNKLVFLACTAPIETNTQFVMKTTYNVYDRNDNLIRKNCTAENVLTLPTGGLTRGQKYTFNLTVNPTYLYVLSDPDLDNPTVTISN